MRYRSATGPDPGPGVGLFAVLGGVLVGGGVGGGGLLVLPAYVLAVLVVRALFVVRGLPAVRALLVVRALFVVRALVVVLLRVGVLGVVSLVAGVLLLLLLLLLLRLLLLGVRVRLVRRVVVGARLLLPVPLRVLAVLLLRDRRIAAGGFLRVVCRGIRGVRVGGLLRGDVLPRVHGRVRGRVRGPRRVVVVGVGGVPGLLGGGRRLGLGRGAQPAGAAALSVDRLGGDGGRRLLGQVVVDLPAAARQRHDHQDQEQSGLRPDPRGVRDRGVVGEVQTAALRGQLEALGPAVDGLAGQRLSVQGRRPARVGGVRDPQHAALLAGRDLGVGLDGGRADRNVLALAGSRGDHDAGDLAVHPPQGAAVELAEAAEAGRRVEDPAHLARCSVPDEDVADREAAELAALVGAGAGDEVGDDLVEVAVAAARLGEFTVAEAGARAADQAVRHGVG